jgi:integrative and conjugative element protein (TIGR02256 family)
MMNNEEIVFRDKSGQLVVIEPIVVDKLLSYRQMSPLAVEAGGVLIGERRGGHIVICDISEPGPGDHQTRYCVNRKGPHHQQKVMTAFKSSNGHFQYIGEWHTHPEDIPSPSSIDVNSWRGSIQTPHSMVVMIIGRRNIWIGTIFRKVITVFKAIN